MLARARVRVESRQGQLPARLKPDWPASVLGSNRRRLPRRIRRAIVILESHRTHNGTEAGRSAGHAGPDDPEDSRRTGLTARVRHRPSYRGNEQEPPRPELRDALSRAPEARAGRLHQGGVAPVREQSQGQVLRADGVGKEATGARSPSME